MSALILHITSRQAWQAAQADGEYRAASLAREGFIHCSTNAQVVPVAEKFYKGQHGLVLLVIDPVRLRSPLKWEAPSDGVSPNGVPAEDSFPHIHGPLNLDAVIKILDFEPGADGRFISPAPL